MPAPTSQQFSYLHLFPNNPYPQPPPPPPIAHKVWILDCKACGMFVTNRAMKAVLLLRPNVSLYSSDALPLNCSAHSLGGDIMRLPSSHKQGPAISRTCECLTQTLCCHGCGGPIGYMIVIPCSRCTSSITANNRATNGHRFVFHSSEVIGTERHYVKNEPGVTPFDPPPPPQNIAYPPPHFTSQAFQEQDARSPSPLQQSEYLPTPPLEFASPAFATSSHQTTDGRVPHYDHTYWSSRSPHPTSLGDLSYQYASHPRASSSGNVDFYPTDPKDSSPILPSLLPGDVIFWHHLSRNGEISGVVDDERARHPATAKAAGQVFFDR